MRLKDYKNLVLERSNDFIKDNSVGIIVKTAEEIGENRYGVHIPRLMMGTETKKGPFEEEVDIDTNKCLNSINKNVGETSVIASNYIHLTMFAVYNISMPKLICGEKVNIGVVDQDIKSMYIKPFSRDQIKHRPSDILEMYVPASGNHNGEDLSDDNKYYMRFDSESQLIRIHMSNANGEVSEYDIGLDGSNGAITLTDGTRSITLNTKSDEIFMVNEAESTVALRKDSIELLTGKLYVKADENIEIESPKMNAKIDNVKLDIKELKGIIDNLKVEGKKLTENYTKTNITNTKRNITSPVTSMDGLLAVTGYVCPGGIGFGSVPGKKPLPIDPQIDKNGFANFAGVTGSPLAKAPQLMQLLTVMATMLDSMAVAPVVPIPPAAIQTLSTLSSQIISPKVKG